MALLLCKQLPCINHHRREGGLIREVKREWKMMMMIMRSVAEKLPYWRRVVFYSSADIGCFACVLGEGLFALEWASTHLTPLAAAHVCQGHMLVCMAVYTQGMQPLYLGPTRGPELVVSLVSRQAITSPKLGQFSAMTATRVRYLAQRKEIVAVSIVFFVRGW